MELNKTTRRLTRLPESGKGAQYICKKHIQIDIFNEHFIEPVGVGREIKTGIREVA